MRENRFQAEWRIMAIHSECWETATIPRITPKVVIKANRQTSKAYSLFEEVFALSFATSYARSSLPSWSAVVATTFWVKTKVVECSPAKTIAETVIAIHAIVPSSSKRTISGARNTISSIIGAWISRAGKAINRTILRLFCLSQLMLLRSWVLIFRPYHLMYKTVRRKTMIEMISAGRIPMNLSNKTGDLPFVVFLLLMF